MGQPPPAIIAATSPAELEVVQRTLRVRDGGPLAYAPPGAAPETRPTEVELAAAPVAAPPAERPVTPAGTGMARYRNTYVEREFKPLFDVPEIEEVFEATHEEEPAS